MAGSTCFEAIGKSIHVLYNSTIIHVLTLVGFVAELIENKAGREKADTQSHGMRF